MYTLVYMPGIPPWVHYAGLPLVYMYVGAAQGVQGGSPGLKEGDIPGWEALLPLMDLKSVREERVVCAKLLRSSCVKC